MIFKPKFTNSSEVNYRRDKKAFSFVSVILLISSGVYSLISSVISPSFYRHGDHGIIAETLMIFSDISLIVSNDEVNAG